MCIAFLGFFFFSFWVAQLVLVGCWFELPCRLNSDPCSSELGMQHRATGSSKNAHCVTLFEDIGKVAILDRSRVEGSPRFIEEGAVEENVSGAEKGTTGIGSSLTPRASNATLQIVKPERLIAESELCLFN